jgi:hypothetical protein
MQFDVVVDDPMKLLTCVTVDRVNDELYWMYIGIDVSKVEYKTDAGFDKLGFGKRYYKETTLYVKGLRNTHEARVTLLGDVEDLLNLNQVCDENHYGLLFVLAKGPKIEDRHSTTFEYWRG